MFLTDKKIYYEKFIFQKLYLMAKRSDADHNDDNLLIVEGDTGKGKSTLSFQLLYLFAHLSERMHKLKDGKVNNCVHFDADKLLNEAKTTEEGLFQYDEPANDMLTTEWYKETQRNLLKLLMTGRVLKHFFIFCLEAFWKFKSDITRRAVGMVRVYSPDGVKKGYLRYYPKESLTELIRIWDKEKRLAYDEVFFYQGTFTLKGSDDIIDMKEYNELKKREAIETIGTKEDKNKARQETKLLKYKIAKLKFPINSLKEVADQFKISYHTLRGWVNENSSLLDTPNQ